MEFYKCYLISVGAILVLVGLLFVANWYRNDAPEWVKALLYAVCTSLLIALFIWILSNRG